MHLISLPDPSKVFTSKELNRVFNRYTAKDESAFQAKVLLDTRQSCLYAFEQRVKNKVKRNSSNRLSSDLGVSFGHPWWALFALPFVAFAANPGIATGIVIASIVVLCLASALSAGIVHQVRLRKETTQLGIFTKKVAVYRSEMADCQAKLSSLQQGHTSQ